MHPSPIAETSAAAYLSIRALAEYASVCERSVKYWLTDPLRPLPHYKLGRRTVVKRLDFELWAAQHRRVGATTEERIRNSKPLQEARKRLKRERRERRRRDGHASAPCRS